MLGNDISNKQAPILAFNVDNLLFDIELREKRLAERFKDLFKFKEAQLKDRPIDKNFTNTIGRVWIRNPYSIYFITFGEDEQALSDILSNNGTPYTSLVKMSDWEELREKCSYQYMYYFDKDSELLSYISANNALHIENLPNIIK